MLIFGQAAVRSRICRSTAFSDWSRLVDVRSRNHRFSGECAANTFRFELEGQVQRVVERSFVFPVGTGINSLTELLRPKWM